MVGNIGIIVMVTAILIVGINDINKNNRKEEIKKDYGTYKLEPMNFIKNKV